MCGTRRHRGLQTAANATQEPWARAADHGATTTRPPHPQDERGGDTGAPRFEREPVADAPDASGPARRAGAGGLRASDSDRSAVAEALRRHATAGRLSFDELDARLGAALAARTRGELSELLRDLPAVEARPAPHQSSRRPEWAGYLWIMALLVTIWALTGAGHPWPLYPALGWGIPLLLAHGASRPHPRQ